MGSSGYLAASWEIALSLLYLGEVNSPGDGIAGNLSTDHELPFEEPTKSFVSRVAIAFPDRDNSGVLTYVLKRYCGAASRSGNC